MKITQNHRNGFDSNNVSLDHDCAKSKSFTELKIACLNVNGLHSKAKYGILELFIQDFDFICLSETKCHHIDKDLFPGYTHFLKKKNDITHPYGGIHGVCMLIKNDIEKQVTLIEDTVSDSLLCIRFHSRETKNGFIICALYIPHEGSPYCSSDIFEVIADDLMNLNVKYALPIILAGDFNSRTGLLSDFIDNDPLQNIDLNDFIDECLFSSKRELEALGINTQRYNSDVITNNHGRNLIELCKMLDIKIVNGRFGKDSNIGDFTCFATNGKSCIDYFIVSPKLMSGIIDFNVEQYDSCLSDTHSALSMVLRLEGRCYMQRPGIQEEENLDLDSEEIHDTNDFEYEELKTKWSNDIKSEYMEAFSSSDINLLIQKLDSLNPSNVTQNVMDDIVKDLGKLYIDPARHIGICKKVSQNKSKVRDCKKISQPWFDRNCINKRTEYMKIKNRLKKIKTNEARMELKARAKTYKRIINQAKRSFRKKFSRNIRNLKRSNTKDYWNFKRVLIRVSRIVKLHLKPFGSILPN